MVLHWHIKILPEIQRDKTPFSLILSVLRKIITKSFSLPSQSIMPQAKDNWHRKGKQATTKPSIVRMVTNVR
jgi:hypothetical protein